MCQIMTSQECQCVTYEDRVETLQEGHAVDEIEALTRRRADRVDNEVHVVCGTADCSVERPL